MGGQNSHPEGLKVEDKCTASGLERVQYIEHRRRSSLINMEETMIAASTPEGSHSQSPASKLVASASNGTAPAKIYKVMFSAETEVFSRPRTTRKDKPTLHYSSRDFVMVRTL